MKLKGILLLLSVFCIKALSFADDEQSHTVLYSRTAAPEGSDWKILQQAENEQLVTFTIALKQRNLDKLQQLFWANSDPKNSRFAQHMPRDKILKMIAPSEEVQNTIIEWIQQTAIAVLGTKVTIKNMQDSLRVTAPVKLINELFQTTMHVFVNTKNNLATIKHLGSLSVPNKVAEYVDLITGITEFPPHVPQIVSKKEPAARLDTADNLCNVPYNMKKLYGVPLDLVVDHPLVNASVYSELSDFAFGVPQLAEFEFANNLAPNPINCLLGNSIARFDPNKTNIEAQLDVQAVEAMAPGVKMCFYMMDSSNGWMYEFANEIFHTPNAPLIVSISYTWDEDQQCRNSTDDDSGQANCTNLGIPNSRAYVDRTNVEFMKLGLAGFTLLVAAGDGGTVGNHGSPNHCRTMEPLFPSSSPYVTSVGATSIEPSNGTPILAYNTSVPPVCTNPSYFCKCSTSTNEQPALANNTAEFDTGGGFSNYIPMPDYQKKAVLSYLKSGITLPTASLWNSSGRAYPDLAAFGSNFCMIDDNGGRTPPACVTIGGSSISTPLWGGMVALFNQDRIKAGKTPLGFMNQVIYQMFEESPFQYFNNNFGPGNNAGRCPARMGFNSVPGHWTPLTGVGSPRFDQIRQYIAALP